MGWIVAEVSGDAPLPCHQLRQHCSQAGRLRLASGALAGIYWRQLVTAGFSASSSCQLGCLGLPEYTLYWGIASSMLGGIVFVHLCVHQGLNWSQEAVCFGVSRCARC